MLAQDFTKSLRNKDIAISERVQNAIQVLDGSESLYLPQKELVILEWVFSALTTEADARKSQDVWRLLINLWPLCNQESRSKFVRSYNLTKILLETWKLDFDTSTLHIIEGALRLIFESEFISIASDSLAGSLILGYLDHARDEPTNILDLFKTQLTSRSHIFKDSKGALKRITGVPNNAYFLIDYFSMPDASLDCDAQCLGEVMQTIVASNVDVAPRFKRLCDAFPGEVHTLLNALGDYAMDKQILASLLSDQISAHNWQVISILLDEIPAETAQRLEQIVPGLNKEFDLTTAIKLIQRSTQVRKLTDFVVAWDNCNNQEWFSTPIINAITLGLEQLSQHQLEVLLSRLFDLTHVLPLLSYKNIVSEKMKTKFLELLKDENPQVIFSILSLWPSAIKDHPDVVSHVVSLKDLSCTLIMIESGFVDPAEYLAHLNQVKINKPYEHIQRFYKILGYMDVSKLIKALSHTEVVQLLKINGIWEYSEITSPLLQYYLENKWDLQQLQGIPLEALPQSSRAELLVTAWNQKDIALLVRMLKTSVGTTKYETDPKYLVKLAKSSDEGDSQSLIDLTNLLVAQDEYMKQLKEAINPKKDWRMRCLAVCTVESSEDAESLKELLEADLASEAAVLSTLTCLLHLTSKFNVKIDAKVLGNLRNLEDTSTVFKLLCRSTDDLAAITAYFIYTGSQHTTAYLEFAKAFSAEEVTGLIVVLIREKYFKAVKTVFPATDLKEQDLKPYITLLAQSVFTSPSALSETEAIEFLDLMGYLFREKSRFVSQYALETAVVSISQFCSPKFETEITAPVAFFQGLCHLLNYALLAQRHRLKSRNHLIVQALSSLMRCLAGSKLTQTEKTALESLPKFAVHSDELPTSVAAADSLSRVITTYCNPPQRSVRDINGKNSLTSSVAQTRRYISRTSGVLVANYATLWLDYGFNAETLKTLQTAIFNVLDILSVDELKAVTASMDNAGRTYMKTVYENYIAVGKWKND